jgi:hypothetical protein
MKNLSTLCPGKDFNWSPLAIIIGFNLLDKAMFITVSEVVFIAVMLQCWHH